MKWRLTIRTKLITGLLLVLAISAILTANTLIGLYSYRRSIKAFDSQMKELDLGKELWDRVSALQDLRAGRNQRGMADPKRSVVHARGLARAEAGHAVGIAHREGPGKANEFGRVHRHRSPRRAGLLLAPVRLRPLRTRQPRGGAA